MNRVGLLCALREGFILRTRVYIINRSNDGGDAAFPLAPSSVGPHCNPVSPPKPTPLPFRRPVYGSY